jgi:hypothetical protein
MFVQDGQARWEIAQSLLSLMADRATGAEELRPYFLVHLAKTFSPYPWARGCFRHALNPARAQQAKALELRAAMSLNGCGSAGPSGTMAHEVSAATHS